MKMAEDWKKAEQEAVELLSSLLKINTTNPPGNEIEAAKFIAGRLSKEGIQSTILESAPGRGNIVARLKGTGEEKPLLLISHLDVVEANESEWSHGPFSGEIADGFIWGRGAVDMKNMAAMEIMTMLLLKRSGAPLKRDVIFAGVADEEAGGSFGAKWLAQNHPDLIKAEYALNEAGGFTIHVNGKRYYPIQIAEKGYVWIKLTARGIPGHGSMPTADNAVVRISRAVDAIAKKGLRMHVTRPVEVFIRSLAETQTFPTSLAMKGLLSPFFHSFIVKHLVANKDQARNFTAFLHNTANPTMLNAGAKVNVVPSSASVTLDCRILPGMNNEKLLAELKEVIGEGIEFEILSSAPPREFDYRTPLFETIKRNVVKADPEGIPVPYMLIAFTDAQHLAGLGIKTYGFSPIKLGPDLPYTKLPHGIDERIPTEGFLFGLKLFYETVSEFTTQPAG